MGTLHKGEDTLMKPRAFIQFCIVMVLIGLAVGLLSSSCGTNTGYVGAQGYPGPRPTATNAPRPQPWSQYWLYLPLVQEEG